VPERIAGTEGLSEATDAFRTAMDAESPSRSVRRTARKSEAEEDNRQDLEDVFPNRQMDRSEAEGGADDDPEPVRRARAERQGGKQNFGEVEDEDEGEDDPTEGDDPEPEDEPEDEPDEPEDEDEEEGEEQTAEFNPNLIVRVNVDGKPIEVSLGEALNGYIRQETFHQRVGEVSNAAKVLYQAKQELDGKLAEHIDQSNALLQIVETFMPQEPNWEEQWRANPQNASYLKFQWDEIQKKLDSVRESRARAEAERAAIYQERIGHYISANRAKMAASHPEWRNERIWRRDQESMYRTAYDEGYSPEEVAQLYDARAMNILLDASKYRRMMKNKPKPVRQHATPTRQHGATPQRGNVSRTFDRAEKRLSRTASLKDAERAFQGILDREG